MDLGVLSLAFSAGLVTFLSPCAYAMLPAYIGYQLSLSERQRDSPLISMLRGILSGGAVSLGFILVFSVMGALVSAIGVQIGPYLPLVGTGVGILLMILGVLWLTNVKLSFSVSAKVSLRRGYCSLFLFGIAYALASAACAFPVFLMVVFSAVSSGGFLSGVVTFLAYSLGMTSLMVPLAVGVSLSKNLMTLKLGKVLPYIQKVGALILISAGLYLIYLQGWIS